MPQTQGLKLCCLLRLLRNTRTPGEWQLMQHWMSAAPEQHNLRCLHFVSVSAQLLGLMEHPLQVHACGGSHLSFQSMLCSPIKKSDEIISLAVQHGLRV